MAKIPGDKLNLKSIDFSARYAKSIMAQVTTASETNGAEINFTGIVSYQRTMRLRTSPESVELSQHHYLKIQIAYSAQITSSRLGHRKDAF